MLLVACIGCATPAPPPSESAAPPNEAVDEPVQPLPLFVALDAGRVQLGEKLFYDPGLSHDGRVSCATCHPLDRGGADGLSHSRGSDGRVTLLNTPTLLNVSLNFRFNWNGAYATLEDELDAPLAKSMNTDWPGVLAAVSASPAYREAFIRAYPDGVTVANIRDALATFERSLVTPNARFDRFLRGDAAALTDDEKAGWAFFKEYGCASCHQGRNAGGNMFQRIGVMRDYFAERTGTTRSQADLGRYAATKSEADRHVFRVPPLRNVALTAPYFHDGSAETLEQAIGVMARYQLGRTLPPEHVTKIAAFLGTLTGEAPRRFR
jgi:cytochrome c peroxidase